MRAFVLVLLSILLCLSPNRSAKHKPEEDALRKSDQENAAILGCLKNVAVEYLDPQVRIIWSNTSVQKYLGLSEDEMKGKHCFEITQGLDSPCPGCTALKALQTGQSQESELVTPDGKSWISRSSPLKDANKKVTGVVQVTVDISDRKRAEEALQESEKRYRSLFENMLDGFAYCKMLYDDQGRPVDFVYLNVNSAFERLTGLRNVVGKRATEAIPGIREAHPELFDTYSQVALMGKPKKFEIEFKPLGIWLSISVYSTEREYFVAVFDNITERKRAENMLKDSLAEKELLLKEVHHRVKNNLQTISTLLYLQSFNFTDENLIKVFRDSQDRIKSIALIHENLFRSEDLGKVDFDEYVRQLITHLSKSYGDLWEKLTLKVNLNTAFLTIDTALPCGMIINELVSNSLKYAFTDDIRGEICIDLISEDDDFKLVVSDNGVGISGDLDIKNSKTLGLQLVDALVKQIDGRMSLDMINGTRYEIHFKERK